MLRMLRSASREPTRNSDRVRVENTGSNVLTRKETSAPASVTDLKTFLISPVPKYLCSNPPIKESENRVGSIKREK